MVSNKSDVKSLRSVDRMSILQLGKFGTNDIYGTLVNTTLGDGELQCLAPLSRCLPQAVHESPRKDGRLH